MIRKYSGDFLDERRLKRTISSFAEEWGSCPGFYKGGWFNLETYQSFNRKTDDFIVDVTEDIPESVVDFRGLAIGVKRSKINYDLYLCYVSPENRGRGIMNSLTYFLEEKAIQGGCKNLNSVVVPEDNIASLSFHRSHGFTEKKSIGCVEFTKKIMRN